MTDISFRQVEGRRLLIIGEVGTGKTILTRRLLKEALDESDDLITVIDMAPRKMKIEGESVGGPLLKDINPRVRYLTPIEVNAPRLSAKNAEELIKLANENKLKIDALLKSFLQDPTRTLFVNDLSIYLQSGDLIEVLRTFFAARTVVANGYLGERLKSDYGTEVSRRERDLMLKLADKMDLVVRL